MELWTTIFVAIIGWVMAIIGWVVAHHFSSSRDTKNKRREIRVEHLMETYQKLENAIQRSPTDVGSDLEAVVANIQLLGTDEQIVYAKKIANDIVNNKSADLQPLLKSLRNELRKELSLDKSDHDIQYLRMKR